MVSYPSSTEERTALIASIFSDSDEVEMVGHLSGGDAQTFIDAVDEVSSHTISFPKTKDIDLESFAFCQTLDNLSPEIRRRCLHYLSGICGRQNLLPRSLPIPLFCDLTETPQYAGEFGDVWKGQYNGQEVAAKVLRVQTSDLERIRKVHRLQLMRIGELIVSHTAVLQGGRDTEKPSSSERATINGYYSDWRSARDGIGVDGEWEHQRICEGPSRCQSVGACAFLVRLLVSTQCLNNHCSLQTSTRG